MQNIKPSTKRRHAGGLSPRATSWWVIFAVLALYILGRNMGFGNLFAGPFPPVLIYVLTLAAVMCVAIPLARFLPKPVAIILDLIIVIVVLVWAVEQSDEVSVAVVIATILGATSGLALGMFLSYKDEERRIDLRRSELAELSIRENNLVLWWRDGRKEFELPGASALDVDEIMYKLNGWRRTRYSLLSRGARMDVYGSAKKGYAIFVCLEANRPEQQQQWKQLLATPYTNAGSGIEKTEPAKKPMIASSPFQGFRGAEFTAQMLCDQNTALRVVHHFTTYSEIEESLNWVEGNEAYNARPLVTPRTEPVAQASAPAN